MIIFKLIVWETRNGSKTFSRQSSAWVIDQNMQDDNQNSLAY